MISKDFKGFEKRIYLAKPTMHGEEIKYFKEAYDTNWMSTVGKNIDQVEKITAEITGVNYAVALSSGTAALHMAIKAAGVKPGDKVFCTDMTFAATANPIIYEHAEPVFIDTECDTWNMDPKALEKAFEKYPETKVIICVHLYGVPCKMDEIREIADRHGALIIEDAAEALGASYKGKVAGSFGDIGCISFNGNKIITGTSGGALLTNSKEVRDKVKKWATQSRENVAWYEHEELGYNYRMSNIVAGVVRGQFPHLDEHITRKRTLYRKYEEGLRELPIRMNPYDQINSKPNYWLSCMMIDKEYMTECKWGTPAYTVNKVLGKTCPQEIYKKLAKYNIEARPIWKPMHLQPFFSGFDFISLENKNGEPMDIGSDIFSRGLCLPSDISMSEEEQKMIIEIIRSCF